MNNLELDKSMDKGTPFQVPTGYFQNLEGHIMSRLHRKEEFEEIDFIDSDALQAPNKNYFLENSEYLNNIPLLDNPTLNSKMDFISQSTFEVPAGYFDKPVFTVPKKVVPLYSRSSIFTNIAASFIGLLLIGSLYFGGSSFSSTTPVTAYQDISEADWSSYLKEEEFINEGMEDEAVVNLDDISNQEIDEFLDDEKYLEMF